MNIQSSVLTLLCGALTLLQYAVICSVSDCFCHSDGDERSQRDLHDPRAEPIHPNCCCLWRSLHRSSLCARRLHGSHRVSYESLHHQITWRPLVILVVLSCYLQFSCTHPLTYSPNQVWHWYSAGCDHYLPILWDLRERTGEQCFWSFSSQVNYLPI